MEALSAEVSRIQEVMAELTTKIQDGTSRWEVLKAKARVQPSSSPSGGDSFVESTDRTDGRFHGGRHAGGEERQDLCHDTSGCGADLSKWTSNEGGFRPRDRRGYLALDAGCRRQHWQGMVTRWQGCATLLAPQERDVIATSKELREEGLCTDTSSTISNGTSPRFSIRWTVFCEWGRLQ